MQHSRRNTAAATVLGILLKRDTTPSERPLHLMRRSRPSRADKVLGAEKGLTRLAAAAGNRENILLLLA